MSKCQQVEPDKYRCDCSHAAGSHKSRALGHRQWRYQECRYCTCEAYRCADGCGSFTEWPDSALPTHLGALAPVRKMASATPESADPFLIVVEVPAAAGEALADAFFDAIADTAYAMEPTERNGWDVAVYATRGPGTGI